MKYINLKIIIFLVITLLIPTGVNAKEYSVDIILNNINIQNSHKFSALIEERTLFADEYNYDETKWDICQNPNSLKVFKFIGNILKVAFIIIPIVLIVMGSIDFMKAVTAGKEDDIKKAQSAFIKRIIAAVLVFFVPIIVNIVMRTVLGKEELTQKNCFTCVISPSTCNTN